MDRAEADFSEGVYRRSVGSDDTIAAREQLEHLARRGAHILAAADQRAQRLEDNLARRNQILQAKEDAWQRAQEAKRIARQARKRRRKERFERCAAGLNRLLSMSAIGALVWPTINTIPILTGFLLPIHFDLGGVFLAASTIALLVVLLSLAYEARRARVWLQTLPFDCTPIWTLLGRRRRKRDQHIVLRFQQTTPKIDMVRNLIACAHLRGFKVTEDDLGVIRIKTPRLGRNGNYRLWRWFVKLAERVLLPLHEVYPIKQVREDND